MAQYGDYWRFMKKLCMTRLLAVPQMDSTIDIREEETEKLVERVTESTRDGNPCDLSRQLTTLTNNTACRMAMSARCSGSWNEAEEIYKLIKLCLKLAGKLSVGDVLGPLKMLDFSGNGKKLVSALQRFDVLVERIMKEHELKVIVGGTGARDQKKDLLDILLESHRDPTAEVKISRKDIKSFLLVSLHMYTY